MYLKFRKISTCKFQPEFYQNVRKQIGKAYELTSAKCPDVNRLAVRISLAYAFWEGNKKHTLFKYIKRSIK